MNDLHTSSRGNLISSERRSDMADLEYFFILLIREKDLSASALDIGKVQAITRRL